MRKLRFGFGVIALNAEEFIQQSIASVYDFADQIWVADGATPAGRNAAGRNGESTDRTLEILHSFPDPEHKLHILPSRFYRDKNEQSNAYMEAMDADPPDYVWQLDSDELYFKDDLERVAELIQERDAGHVMFRALHFWHNLRTVAWGSWWSSPAHAYHRVNRFRKGWRYERHRPPMILVDNKPLWETTPVITADDLERDGVYMYHYSHVTDEQVRRKMDWYQQDGSWKGNWYADVWKRWEMEPEVVEREIGTHPANIKFLNDPYGKGVTRSYRGTHPAAMQTHRLWKQEYAAAPTASAQKVLHIINNLSPGGGCISPMQFADRAVKQHGEIHDFFVLNGPVGWQPYIPQGLKVFGREDRTLEQAASWISGIGYDVLHWHWWYSNRQMNEFMDLMGTYGGHKRIITCDVYPAAPEFTLSDRAIRYADVIVFDGKASLYAYPRVPDSKKRYVIGGTDLEPYRSALRTRKSDGKFLMGRGSTLTPWKCPPDLIAMVAPVLAALPQSEFHIWGDGELTKRFEADIKRLGLQGRVIMRGWVKDFAAEIVDLDLYLYHLPRLSFASSELNLQGIMAAGIPIVIMPSTGTRWMFEHNIDALVAESPEEVVKFCLSLFWAQTERQRLGQNARSKAYAEYGMDNMIKGYLNDVYPACRMRFGVAGQNLPFRKAEGQSGFKSMIKAVVRWTGRVVIGGICRISGSVKGALYKAAVRLKQVRYGIVRTDPNYYICPRNLGPTSVIVDIGTGYNADFSVSLIRRYGVSSFGFEPTRKHHAELNNLVTALNGRFTFFPLALNAKPEDVVFFESETNVSGSLLNDHINIQKDPVNEYQVKAVTLSDVFKIIGSGHIDVLKIDVEGAEYAVFDALDPELLHNVGQIIMEFHHLFIGGRFTYCDTERIIRRIKAAGFKSFTTDHINFLFFRTH